MIENKLYKKYFISSFLGILLVNLVITSLLYIFLINKGAIDIYKSNISSAKINFEMTENFLNHNIDHFKNIVYSIEKSDTFYNYIKNGDKTSLVNTFKVLLNSNTSLFQIRFIDKEGLEKVRVDKNDNYKVYEVIELQDKSNRYYFKKTISLYKNSFYISDLDLNVEYGKLEIPYKPTIRVSKPVYDKDKLLGILIINYDSKDILDFIKDKESFDVYLMDKNKNFFLHPNKEKNFSTQLSTNHEVKDEIPNIDEIIAEKNTFDKNSKYYISKIDLTDNEFYLIYSLKEKVYENLYTEIRNEMLYIFLLVFFITLPLIIYFLNKQASQSVILESIIDNTPFPIFLKNLDGRIVMVNESMIKLTGIENKKDIINKKLDEIFDKKDALKFEVTIEKLKDSINNVQEEMEIFNKDGKKYFYDVKVIKLPILGFFKQTYILGIAVDITELKSLNLQLKETVDIEIKNRLELEKTLLQHSKMAEIGNMIGNIIHQWKQPLSIISVIASGSKLKIDNNLIDLEELKKNFTHIEEQVIFINETAQDFRDFFSPNKEKENFFLQNVIMKIERILSNRIDRLSIIFENNIDKNIFIYGYENDFGQVVLSILNNSIDKCEKIRNGNFVISVNVEKIENLLILKISDNGGLIPSELLPDKLFEKYFTTKKEGTGLGLSICKKIIEDNFNGGIKAYNENNCAVLEIVLPIKK